MATAAGGTAVGLPRARVARMAAMPANVGGALRLPLAAQVGIFGVIIVSTQSGHKPWMSLPYGSPAR